MLTLMAGEDSYGTAHVPLLQGFFVGGGGDMAFVLVVRKRQP